MKTKILFFNTLFYFFCITVYCQQEPYIYIDSIYDCNNNKLAGAFTVYETNYGYFVVGISKSVQNRKVICVLKTDKQGNKLEVKNFGKSNCDLWPGAWGSLIKTNDGGYALGGGITSGTNDKFLLVKFNANGDTLWTKSYGDSAPNAFCTARQCKQCWDKGYILVGEKYYSSARSDVMIVKTDSLGNFQWQKTYGEAVNVGWTIDIARDSGFIIGGYKKIYGINYSKDALVIKTDSLGNMIWYKILGGSFDDGGAKVNVAKDGNFFITFTYAYSQAHPTEPSFSKLDIIKSDISGNIIFDKKVGPIRGLYAMPGFYELPNGNLINAGYYTPSGSITSGKGVIFMLNANGDSVWMRDYKRVLNNGSNDLYNIQQTSDNGLIACGEVFGAFEPPYGQNMWLLKLDSMGCLEPNCDGTIIIEPDNNKNMGIIELYPNPAQNKLNITIKASEPNCSVLQIYNLQGQVLIEQKIEQQQIVVDISELPDGVYFAKMGFENGSWAQERFVVVK